MTTYKVKATKYSERYEDQKPGTSGLRKKVKVFQQPHYLHNFVQSLFDVLQKEGIKGQTLCLGGDGRFWNKEAIQIILALAAGNGVGKVIVGKDGIVSTPALSAIVRARKLFGGIILTASHNPGGPTNDFGIKYNMSNGGPAQEATTSAIFDISKTCGQYLSAPLPPVDLSKLGVTEFKTDKGTFVVEIIDPVDDYLALMKQVFDFPALKAFVSRSDFPMVIDSMYGVTAAYTHRVFVQELGATPGSLLHAECKEDFGGGHPDPNLTYAKGLVEKMYSGSYEFGAAFDGDGDRNMILGNKFFVNPSDSVAVIAANASTIPYFAKGVAGVARSMPTSGALDRVANKLKLTFHETPTGWKFFGNLMDAGKCHICGEESFGTGSDHIREKDGIWAVLAWLSILAAANKNVKPGGKLVTVADVVQKHWATYGRNFFSRYDYEEVSSDGAKGMMEHLRAQIPSLPGKKLADGYTIERADDFQYTDPIDGSIASKQGLRFIFTDGSRFVFRLSGTGSSGATVRLYVEQYEADANKAKAEAQDALKTIIEIALKVSDLKKFTGRDKPTVIT